MIGAVHTAIATLRCTCNCTKKRALACASLTAPWFAGCNRTGFVICAYLIQRLGFAPQQALDAFAQVRPGGVNHQNYRQEILARYSAHSPVGGVTASPAIAPASAGVAAPDQAMTQRYLADAVAANCSTSGQSPTSKLVTSAPAALKDCAGTRCDEECPDNEDLDDFAALAAQQQG